MLTTVEPVYESHAKIWSKEKQEESKLLQVKKFGSQEDTYADVQKNIITSNVVLEEVVDKLGLITPPPSNSIKARFFPSEPEELENPEKAIREAIKALKGNVWVETINPEILRIDVRMNTPELATSVAAEVIVAYKKQYLMLLTQEVNQYEKFLAEHMALVQSQVDIQRKRLLDFESHHPELSVSKDGRATPKNQVSDPSLMTKNPHNSKNKGSLPAGKFKNLLGSSTPLVFVKDMGDVSAVPEIMEKLAELKMARNSIIYSAGKENTQLKLIEVEIQSTEKFLKEQMSALSKQSQAAIEHESILWDYSEARRHLLGITSEYNKILLSRGAKLKQISSIIILDPPSYDSQKVYPRKKATLMAAIFLGALLGLAIAYLRHLSDGTFHLPEEVTDSTGFIVLGSSQWLSAQTDKEGFDANTDG